MTYCLQTMLTYILETINEVDRTYHFSVNYSHPMIWVKVFKSGPSKIKGCLPQVLRGPFLNTLTHLFCALKLLAV